MWIVGQVGMVEIWQTNLSVIKWNPPNSTVKSEMEKKLSRNKCSNLGQQAEKFPLENHKVAAPKLNKFILSTKIKCETYFQFSGLDRFP